MTFVDPTAGMPASLFSARRRAVVDQLGNGVMVLPAAPRLLRSRDTELAYRPDSELFYLTGCTEPGAVAVVVGGPEARFVLFVQERDGEAELWSGARMGPEGAEERFAPDEVHGLSELDRVLPGLLRAADRVYFRLGRAGSVERHVLEALAWARVRGARKGRGPRGVEDPGQILDELRLVKDEHEIERIRAAAAASVEGHRAAFSMLTPGVGEWAVQAAVEASFRSRGGRGPGFETIVGSGPNACVLHYVDNRRTIEEGDLVLVDAGADVGLYQGDVTRTCPASGRFSDLQRAVHEVVERARQTALSTAGPGATLADVHNAAAVCLAEGLVDLGVLTGTPEDLVAEEAHAPFFPHQTSHWLGLDVHDPGDYMHGGVPRRLEPGMVFTVEPGLYFPTPPERVPALAGIGIRIEDDVLITQDGVENLTAGLPTGADDMEALVSGSRG